MRIPGWRSISVSRMDSGGSDTGYGTEFVDQTEEKEQSDRVPEEAKTETEEEESVYPVLQSVLLGGSQDTLQIF